MKYMVYSMRSFELCNVIKLSIFTTTPTEIYKNNAHNWLNAKSLADDEPHTL